MIQIDVSVLNFFLLEEKLIQIWNSFNPAKSQSKATLTISVKCHPNQLFQFESIQWSVTIVLYVQQFSWI
jgi:hypothetical protein